MTSTIDARRTAAPRSDQPRIDPAAPLDAVRGDLAYAFDATEWAEDEIDRATRRHPTAANLLYHAFTLIRPRDLGPRMVEFVYRSHAAELLDGLAGGQDTREPTAAKMCLACCEISQRVPLHGPAAGVYLRLWARAFPGQPATADQAEQLHSHERLHGSQIDDLEAELRRRLRDPQRRLQAVDCQGRHHGRPVRCRYTGAEVASGHGGGVR